MYYCHVTMGMPISKSFVTRRRRREIWRGRAVKYQRVSVGRLKPRGVLQQISGESVTKGEFWSMEADSACYN